MPTNGELGEIAQQIVATNDQSGKARLQRIARTRELDRLQGQLKTQESVAGDLGMKLGEAAREIVVTKYRIEATKAKIAQVDEAEVERMNRMARLFDKVPNAEDLKQMFAQVDEVDAQLGGS